MATINDRIGSQNVIRVLANASSPPSNLIDLFDVNTTLKTVDGMLLVWDLGTQTFIMTSVIDSSSLTVNGISAFTDATDSSSVTSGAFVVTGGVGVGKNLNIGGSLNVVGVATFGSSSIVIDGDNGILRVGTGVTISSDNGITAPSLNLDGALEATSLKITGVTTLASDSGITTTGGDFYVGTDAYIGNNLRVQGQSFFEGNVTFKGGTIGIGNENTDDINVVGEFISNLVPDVDNTYDLGIDSQRWRNGKFSGLLTSSNLYVSGISTFDSALDINSDVNITGFVTVTEGLYYDSDDYDGPNGIAYFDNTGKLIGAASTENALTETYFVLTTNAVGIPTWTSVIDGGEY